MRKSTLHIPQYPQKTPVRIQTYWYVGVPNAYFVAPWGRGGHPVYTQSPALIVQSYGVQHFVNARDKLVALST